MSRMTGSWLSGPSSALPPRYDEAPQSHRGEALGLPAEGPGALVGTGRRIGALFVDWIISLGIAALISRAAGIADVSSVTVVVWAVLGVVCVWLFAMTPGQAALGMGVARVDAPVRVGLVRALFRVVLIFFIVPPLINDKDGRGLHDRATQTALIRSR